MRVGVELWNRCEAQAGDGNVLLPANGPGGWRHGVVGRGGCSRYVEPRQASVEINIAGDIIWAMRGVRWRVVTGTRRGAPTVAERACVPDGTLLLNAAAVQRRAVQPHAQRCRAQTRAVRGRE